MGTRSGSVFMEFDDGTKGWVPSRNVPRAKADGGKLASIRLRSPGGQERVVSGASASRLMDAGATEVESGQEQQGRSVIGAMGGHLQSATAAIPGMAAQSAPMMIPGGGFGPSMARIGTAFGAGTAADIASKGIMGEEQNPMSSAVMGGLNAAWQAPFEGAAGIVSRLPRPFMKSALGNSTPGMDEVALRRGQVVSNEGLSARQGTIGVSIGKADAAVDASSKTFPRQPFIRLLEGMQRNAARSDLVSGAQSDALGQALDRVTGMMGPKVTTTAASKLFAPGRSAEASTGPARGASVSVRGRAPMKAKEVDDIRRFADNEAKALRKSREANNDKKVGDLEGAYLQVTKLATRMLRTIPEVKSNRLQASEDIRLHKATFNALKRAGQKPTSPMAAIMHLGQSPEGLSRWALKLNNPNLTGAIRNVPRVLGVAAADALSRQR